MIQAGRLLAFAFVVLPPPPAHAGSTLEEMCDCNTVDDYGYRCGCGNPANDPHIDGCCNLRLGSCNDFCEKQLHGGDQAPHDGLGADEAEELRQEVKRLQDQVAALSTGASGSAGSKDLLAAQQKFFALEKAFQLQAITLEQFEAAHAALRTEQERASSAALAALDAAVQGGGSEPDCVAPDSCAQCREAGCAWCVGARKCVPDKPWICAGDTDHIGTKGTRMDCPSQDDLEREREQRRLQEADASAEAARLAAGSCDDTGSADGGAGGGGTTDGEDWEAEIARRVAAAEAGEGGATQPYAALGLDSSATQGAIRKAYRKVRTRTFLQRHLDVTSSSFRRLLSALWAT